jgi:ABC-type transport system involved in multi-copper enzyme maturation permease subunit
MISPIPVPLPHWSTVTLVHLGTAMLLLSVAALLVRRLARKQLSDAPVMSSLAETLRPRPRREVSDNPVRWREMRRPLLARPWQRVVAVMVTVGLMLFSYYSFSREGFDGLNEAEVHVAYAFLFTGLFWLVSTVLSATAVAHERESDTWTLLVASPLSARKIVLGKLFGVLWKLRYPMLIPLAHLLLVGPLAGAMALQAGVAAIAVMICFNLPWIAIGVSISVYCRKVTTAVVLSLLIPIGAMVGTSFAFSIAEELTRLRGLSDQSLWIIPYHWQERAIEMLGRGFPIAAAVPRGAGIEFGGVLAIACLAQVIVAAAILWRLVAHFDRIVGRSPQHEPLPNATAVTTGA